MSIRGVEFDEGAYDRANEAYFDESFGSGGRVFDARLLRAPISLLKSRVPIVLSESDCVADAVREMQSQHRGVVLISEDGSRQSRLTGIFTERDVLLRVVERGRNLDRLSLGEVMVRDPEALPQDAPLAWALNKMSVGGFRHVPAVDGHGRPVFVVSVKDVVEFLVEAFPREVLNLPPEFGRQRYRERDGA
ncbi:MAG: CBS domain-containing protein [Deltaproteobacteria bacterium]|nr:CBS domain-containing protein [Deltaproteobacteria bacterium]MBW2417650.1 CBS domain-containing protein [Deltaproteobacteria bacterium]